MTPRASHPQETGFDPKVTLDSVFRRNVLMQPGALALADPPDREAIVGGAPRRFNYAEADIAVSRLAAQLKAIGLPEQAVVAIQLPNTVEAIITLLAVMRAGMIALPLPMPWRRSDLVTALREIAPRAFITTTRFGDERPAEIACEVAAELFTLGFPCAFGPDVPDGVIPLDIDARANGDIEPFPPVRGISPGNFAIATFDASRHGPYAVARTHSQWLAAGFAVTMEANIASGDNIVSTMPPSSLAGIAGAFIPWLMIGGTLQLSHGFSPRAAAMVPAGAHLVAPAIALPSLATKDSEGFSSCVAVHRGPETLGLDLSRLNSDAIVDMQLFGETGFTALRRIAKIMPSPIPVGLITAPVETEDAPVVIETRRLADGTLAVRGAMVPDKPITIGGHASAAQLEFDIDNFVRTNMKCHASGGALVIEGMPEGILQIGGLRFGFDDLAMRVAKASSGAELTVARDPILGMRGVIGAPEPERAIKELDEAGLSGVIIDGVRQWPQARRAAS
jgi:CheY-like chemotaxis protein